MRINYKKYGLVRTRENDFSDDGAYFRTYALGPIQVSVCTYKGEYFIAGHASNETVRKKYLNIEHRCTLPGYDKLDMLNGVDAKDITPEKLAEFVAACKEYGEAYLASEYSD